MPTPPRRHDEPVPLRALLLSLAALAVPAGVALSGIPVPADYEALLWLLMLVPAFLLAYYRGWRGVATALAAGMALLSLTQTVLLWLGRPVPDLLLGVAAAYVAIALGIGWLAEAFEVELDEARELAFTDALTGLPNRRRAEEFLEESFAAAERGRSLAVALFDLDDFKDYNDRFGHQVGDRALRIFGGLLAGETRAMDLSARIGGEEFLTVLPGSDARGAARFAERVRTSMAGSPVGEQGLTLSAGVATYDGAMASPSELLDAADRALYRAKRAGRDRVRMAGDGADGRGGD